MHHAPRYLITRRNASVTRERKTQRLIGTLCGHVRPLCHRKFQNHGRGQGPACDLYYVGCYVSVTGLGCLHNLNDLSETQRNPVICWLSSIHVLIVVPVVKRWNSTRVRT